jgi:PIN domain nuclease of toxin-antitoxin system
VRLLLDTHALLWWLAGDGLRPNAAAAVGDPRNTVLVSAVSVWEVGIKGALGKVTIDGDLLESIRATGFEALPITFDHAHAAGALPLHHRDPFDRMLVAQATVEAATLVTRDPAIAAYETPLLGA